MTPASGSPAGACFASVRTSTAFQCRRFSVWQSIHLSRCSVDCLGSDLPTRQQFVAHLFRCHSGPPLVAVRERADTLITDEPGYLRDRKAGLSEIVRGEIGAELIENFTKAQAFRGQSSRQRAAAYAKRRRNSFEPRLAMRQERSDCVFDSDS